MDARIDEVIEAWFGPDPAPTKEIFQRWFTKDPAYDDELRTKFGALHADAAAGTLDRWRETARGELALIVLLDQMSRNMFRDDRRAFATDDVALSLARDLLGSGRARELTPYQRMVALLPFQHAEDRDAQAEGVAAYSTLLDEVRATDPVAAEMLTGSLSYAERHRDIIEKFGRFPHRNAVLGRTSSVEELAFLEQPGSRF
jgi:uncharacterized protein (DUF924 family)